MKKLMRYCIIISLMLVLILAGACGGGDNDTTRPDGTSTATPAETSSPTGNQPPVIIDLTAGSGSLLPGAETTVTCRATDPEGDNLTYSWTASGGEAVIQSDESNWIRWKATNFTGNYEVTVTVADSNGNSASQSVEILVQDNQPPQIKSMNAEPAAIYAGEKSGITCDAVDPEGQAMTYIWRADGGTISGSGTSVSWQSPDSDGEYTITVTVTDAKGAETVGSVKVGVQSHRGTVTLVPLAEESGTVDARGNVLSEYRVGDTDADQGMRAYLSFDISSLGDADIEEATLVFTIGGEVGDPWSLQPPFLYVQPVEYGERSLTAPDYTEILPSGADIIETKNEAPGEINIRFALNRMVLANTTRYQIRVTMADAAQHNYNDSADYLEFEKVELIVKYVTK